MGKSTINGHFFIAMLNYQRVTSFGKFPPMAGLQKALAFESRQSREHFAVRRRLHQLQNAQAKQGQLGRWELRGPHGGSGGSGDSWRFLAGKIIYFYGPYSIAMLNIQMVYIYI